MGKIVKHGRIVVLTTGRFAGRKGIVVRDIQEGGKRKFPHALVAGVETAPQKVTKVMSKKKIAKRTRVKPFVKYVNLNHLLPTRYLLGNDMEKLKSTVTEDKMASGDKRKELRKELADLFKEKYTSLPASSGANDKSNHLRFLFRRLRF
mmetsp:Transcript_84094/g.116889  ORF Transcript_84094/g.116889 Transcript_84094/m.116889 type:complete len:149 (+) Transcript_84094:88-534(+)